MAPGGRTPSLPRGRLHEKAALQATWEAGGGGGGGGWGVTRGRFPPIQVFFYA